MGQKVIPKNLRLNYSKNWESSWISNKNDYSAVFMMDQNIRNYLKMFCEKEVLTWCNIKIERQLNIFKVYLYIQKQSNTKFIEFDYKKQKLILQQNLQKYCNNILPGVKIYLFVLPINYIPVKKSDNKPSSLLKMLKLPKNQRFLSQILKTFIVYKDVMLLNTFITNQLKKNTKHVKYLRNLTLLLNKLYKIYPNFLGYKIQWKGRINGKERARKLIFKGGSIPLNTIKQDIQYDCQEIITPAGICSLKTWLLFSK